MPHYSGPSDAGDDPPIVQRAQKRQDEIIHRLDALESAVHSGFDDLRREMKDTKALTETLKPISNVFTAIETLGTLALKLAALIVAIAILVALFRSGWGGALK